MLEYVFFDQGLRSKFVAYLNDNGLSADTYDADGFIVTLSDDIEQELWDNIDLKYEQLLQENADLLEDTDDALSINASGVQVVLANGDICMIRLAPDLISRLLTAISQEELRDMVQAIAEQVEKPDNSPLCHSR